MNHENVIKMYEVYESLTSVYIVLELLKGGELLNIIESKKVITEG
jgi:serine/threonine protein kinase